MQTINEIDELEVFALMDNVSDPFTESHPGMRWNEFEYHFGIRDKKEICGADLCRACTGLSLLLKIHADKKVFTLLFDTGPDDGLVIDNAKRMGLDLSEVDAIVLSHSHFDHYGGILSVLDHIGKKDLRVYVHPKLFNAGAIKTDDGNLLKISYVLDQHQVEAHGGKVIEVDKPLSLLNDTLIITGEVPRNTSYEKGFPGEMRFCDGSWVSSPDVIDERCLVLKLKNKGICVFTGCGHTGVVNAVHHAQELINEQKVYLVMGGFHLAGNEMLDRIEPTVNDLHKINPNYIVTGHCTGRDAQSALTATFADQHIPYGVGTVFKF